jgi:hypothetical protein
VDDTTGTAVVIFFGILGLIAHIVSLGYALLVWDEPGPWDSLKRRIAKWYFVGSVTIWLLVFVWSVSLGIAGGS